jgi:hypothetical protein
MKCTTHFITEMHNPKSLKAYNNIDKGKVASAHGMKAQWGHRVIIPLPLNIRIGQRLSINFIPWSLYPSPTKLEA